VLERYIDDMAVFVDVLQDVVHLCGVFFRALQNGLYVLDDPQCILTRRNKFIPVNLCSFLWT
jgi:hypothetical protein